MTYKHLTSINVAHVFCRSRTERGRENRIRCTSRQSTKTSLNNTPSREIREIPSIAAFVEVIIPPSQGKLCFFFGWVKGRGEMRIRWLWLAGHDSCWWWFQIFFLCSSLFGEDFQFDYYFSDELKPPISSCWCLHVLPAHGLFVISLWVALGQCHSLMRTSLKVCNKVPWQNDARDV